MTTLADIIKKIFRQKPGGERNYGSGKSFEEQLAELGAFTYTDDGFILTYEGFTKTFKWSDITELNVYKADLFTIDEIRMRIVYGDKQIEISEELPGWHQFVSRTKIIFPSIPQEWDSEIVQPAFATNYRTIYSKADNDSVI